MRSKKAQAIKRRSSKKQPTLQTLTLQTVLIKESKKLALLILCVGAPLLIYIYTIPEEKKLTELEERLENAEKEERLALENNDRITREINAYRSNPEYLEIIARDHLNYYKEGETVIRIER